MELTGRLIPFFNNQQIESKNVTGKKLTALVTKFSNFAHFRYTVLTVYSDKARCRKTGDCLSVPATVG